MHGVDRKCRIVRVRILDVGETVEEKLMALRDQSRWVSAAEHPWLLEHPEEKRR